MFGLLDRIEALTQGPLDFDAALVYCGGAPNEGRPANRKVATITRIKDVTIEDVRDIREMLYRNRHIESN